VKSNNIIVHLLNNVEPVPTFVLRAQIGSQIVTVINATYWEAKSLLSHGI